MKLRRIYRGIALSTALGFFAYWVGIRVTEKDAAHFAMLMQQSHDLRSKSALEVEPGEQERAFVEKSILFDGGKKWAKISSENSFVKIFQQKGKVDGIEELKKISCETSDGYHLLANLGKYSYATKRFRVWDHCLLSKGEDWVLSDRIDWDLLEEKLRMEGVKGHFVLFGFDLEAKELLWDQKRDLLEAKKGVHLTRPGPLSITASSGTLKLDALNPIFLTLRGDVHFVGEGLDKGKTSFAIADLLTYDPMDKKLVFSSEDRVIFWRDDMALSAKSIVIENGTQVYGMGDVRLTLSGEEKEYIDKIFERYL